MQLHVDPTSVVLAAQLGFRLEGRGPLAEFSLRESGVIVAACVLDFPESWPFSRCGEWLGRIADAACQLELGTPEHRPVWELVAEYAV